MVYLRHHITLTPFETRHLATSADCAIRHKIKISKVINALYICFRSIGAVTRMSKNPSGKLLIDFLWYFGFSICSLICMWTCYYTFATVNDFDECITWNFFRLWSRWKGELNLVNYQSYSPRKCDCRGRFYASPGKWECGGWFHGWVALVWKLRSSRLQSDVLTWTLHLRNNLFKKNK